jgi:hypothetical protein
VRRALEGDNLLVLYYLSTSEFWPDKVHGLWWEGSYKRRTTVIIPLSSCLFGNYNMDAICHFQQYFS